MIFVDTVAFKRTYKKLLKRRVISSSDFEDTKKLFEENQNNPTLHFKKIQCKKAKNMYSIRLLNSSYRILMTVENDKAFLRCVCDHDDYERRNKNC